MSVGSVSLMAFPAPNAMFFDMFARVIIIYIYIFSKVGWQFLQAVCSALCMNVAIVGLNQVYDRKIDMVYAHYSNLNIT